MPDKLTQEQLQALAVRFGLETAVLQSLAETASETDAFLPDGRASLFFEGHLFYRNLEKAGISPDTCRAVYFSPVLYKHNHVTSCRHFKKDRFLKKFSENDR